MSDYNDYKENLAFPPKPIGSQDELPEIGRQSEVLIKALEKCEKLENQLREAHRLLCIQYENEYAIDLTEYFEKYSINLD